MSNVTGYAQLKERLDQIVDAVSADDLPLEEALALYEEAVKLGSAASALIEEDINAKTADELANALASEQAESEDSGAEQEAAAEDAPAEASTVEGD